ncbi:macro domain-containing protein [Myxococcus sp. RHSTA-1-4]|uniref:macro domain-containing protein n=1 Tax=Myxococcus sp. RHSTA-1-4 TaxID=2874601 RepID=UPI001CC1BE7F|nr:macro domain-containing protein [Myxococcus sp. RHSTA-1-4]MBZ4423308.1 macro domain-containing protein [Myxococcus sp. RHSTA-1-4]
MSQLTLKLRDLNPAMVLAWRRAFLHCEGVEVSGGDIFEERADAIVSPANSFGYMDGGIDLVYSQFFGWDLQARLRELLRKEHHGELPVGSAVIIETRHAEIPWLVSAPTMRIPMAVPDTVNAWLAFRATLRAVLAHNAANPARPIRSLLCPGLCTAVGKMPPERAARQMRHAWNVVVLGEPWPPPTPGQTLQSHFDLIG